MTALASVVRHERRAAFADPSLLISLAVFLLLAVYALVTGANWLQTRNNEAALAQQQAAERNAGFQKDLATYVSNPAEFLDKPSWHLPWTRSPLTPGAVAVLPSPPLAALATNTGELQPQLANLRAASSRFSLFDDFGASTQNPATLTVGRFDVAFLLIAVLPLLILAFSFNLLSAELEQKTLALVMVQPVPLARIMLGKLLVRAGLILGPVLLIMLMGLALAGSAPSSVADWFDFAWLAVLIVSYGLFWLILAAWVNAHGRSSAANALTLGGLWLALVLVIPALLNIATNTFYPPPDRAELTNELRATLVDARNRGENLVSNFNLQHPDQKSTTNMSALESYGSAEHNLRAWLVRERADELLTPVASVFEARLDAQQRVAEVARFLSPALVFQSALNRLAGVDQGRTRAFRESARAYLDEFRALTVSKIVAGTFMTPADYERLPRFTMPEARRGGALFADWLGIILPALVLAAFAVTGLRRYRVGE